MIRSIYRFRFDKSVPMEDVEKALALSTIAIESIYGEAAMRVDGAGPTHVNLFCDDCMFDVTLVTKRYFRSTCRSI